MENKTFKIDAKGKILGRLAVEVARILQGKHRPDFAPNRIGGDSVAVSNAKDLDLSSKKQEEKMYYHHSGYLGNLRGISLKKLFSDRPEEVLRKAVWNMLPKNKLRDKRIKRLIFK